MAKLKFKAAEIKICKKNYEKTIDRKKNRHCHECDNIQEQYLISVLFEDLHEKWMMIFCGIGDSEKSREMPGLNTSDEYDNFNITKCFEAVK